ncbi:AraC family transcriptional regulator [Nitratireductor aestuarii]|uniref:AraC family transcriptional regulator n=1 Tax=Nitratireductor aestuarii TaxID=1735103 RepID=A0A916RD99_9HYPH|nr:helix-turn-helix domain-containing protein [Nitratireductor aestuarii]GGA51260.1 AraC family transcriptional regulator [Nitratireductor aestuarii]
MSRTIAFVLFDQALGLNLSGPAEVFSLANRHLAASQLGYELLFLSETGGLVRSSSGLALDTDPLTAIESTSLDTLIVVGGAGASAIGSDSPLVRWIRAAAANVRRTCSICNGAFLLAAAGLLNGRRVATHWCEVDVLKSMYPQVAVELDPIYLRDGTIWTSAGMTAGIDLALALIEEDYGRQISLSVARELVVFLHRPGGQAQFSNLLDAQTRLGLSPGADTRLSRLPAWIMDNLSADLSVERLADAVGMSPRTFARRFSQVHAGTPARFVEDLRLEAARRQLEETDMPIKRLASLCGFGDEERMRRAFIRRFGVPPIAIRDRFGIDARKPTIPASA